LILNRYLCTIVFFIFDDRRLKAMEIQEFIQNYREAFGSKAQLPLLFGYSNKPVADTAKIGGLTTYQLNLIRAICDGHHTDFGKSEVTSKFDLGTRSYLVKLKNILVEKEIIEITESGCYLSDPLFEYWFKRP